METAILIVTLAAILADGATTYIALRYGLFERNKARAWMISKLGLVGGTLGVSAFFAALLGALWYFAAQHGAERSLAVSYMPVCALYVYFVVRNAQAIRRQGK
jgi:apolipoprotein N-acyltransferase